MSVDFSGRVAGEWVALSGAGVGTALNVSNANARDLLNWLGIEPTYELCGSMKAAELAARCQRRLWDVERNHDPAIEPEVDGRMVYCGRRAGYLRERTEELLALAELVRRSGGTIHWS